MPALGNVIDVYTRSARDALVDIGHRARSRAELVMITDDDASRQPATDRSPDRDLGWNRGYRDAMIEVMSWVTGQDQDEILAELHDQIAEVLPLCP